MTVYFPITAPLSKDANIIMMAMNSRSEQIKEKIDSHGLLKKITFTALKILGLTTGIVTAASIPVTIIMLATPPFIIGAVSLCTAITCLALYMIFDARSPGELIIKDLWKTVFEALREGDGKKILESCQELAKQKERRTSSFNQCLGSLSANETTPFFHKTCLIGYLQMAMKHLRNGQQEQAKSNAHMALSHFGASGFNQEVEKFIQLITDNPKEMLHLIKICHAGESLHSLDCLMAKRRQDCT